MTIGQKNKNKEFIKLLARRGELDYYRTYWFALKKIYPIILRTQSALDGGNKK